MNKQRILIVDRQAHWRNISAEALSQAGYDIQWLDHYDYSPVTAYFNGTPPDMVILGCASIRQEERVFIEKVLDDNRLLLVLSASLPWEDMRALFLKGARDVTDKTYNPGSVVAMVQETFRQQDRDA